MQRLSPILIATSLFALASCSLTVAAFAADGNDTVKTSRPPYKPGREIDDESAQGNASPSTSSADDSQPVKTGEPPYKPGRQLDEDAKPVKHGHPPYKPGREADDQ